MKTDFYILISPASAPHMRHTFPAQADERPWLCTRLDTDFERSIYRRHLNNLSKRSLYKGNILIDNQIISFSFKLLIRPDFKDDIKIIESDP
jgi:hypothetical protein